MDEHETELWKDGQRRVYRIHRLVYESFKDKLEEGEIIHHKDGNKENNYIGNLEKMRTDIHNRFHFMGKEP